MAFQCIYKTIVHSTLLSLYCYDFRVYVFREQFGFDAC